MKSSPRLSITTLLALLAAVWAAGGVPLEMNYQGRLLDDAGNPLNQNVSVAVTIYTTDEGGSPVYSETVGLVPVQNGIYSFQFGTNSPPSLSTALLNEDCWLEVSIDAAPLSPRQKLVSVPYAVRSAEVEGSADWDTAYGWGNHAAAGYLTVEADPLWSAVSNTVLLQASHGETAYGWGRHDTNGYLTVFVEADPVAATQVWAITQYPRAVLLDGSRAMAGDLDLAGYTFSNGWFAGDGSGLTNLQWTRLTGVPANLDTDSTDDLVNTNIGVNVQAYDADLADLADGTLSKSKVEDSANWDTAYGWGNHAAAGYLTVEADPLWSAVSNTVLLQAAHGETAYGWGRHDTNGYLKTYVEADPVAATQVWAITQYPQAVLLDGSRAMAGDLDLAGYTFSNGWFAGDGSGLTNLQWTRLTGVPANLDTDSTDDLVNTNIGVNVQAYDADLADLADGTLSKSKVEDSANWDTAYGWGDHAAAGYLTVEADPLWSAVSNTVLLQAAHGETAYGWGRHDTNGYLKTYVEADPVAATQVWAITQYPQAVLLDGSRAMAGDLDLAGYTFSNGWFAGDGSGLTNLQWTRLTGVPANLDTDSTDDLVNTNIGVNVQAYDADLADLADGTLSKSKVEDSANWDTAYGWGNHAAAGYLTVEADPLWSAVSNTVLLQAAHGETAYGWGRHDTNGYLKTYVEADPVAATQAWAIAQYPQAVLLDGSRAMTDTLVLPSGGLAVGTTQLVVLANGNVGIGTLNPTNTLAVNGSIKAKEVIITLGGWSDYVFAPDYKLLPLADVEAFIAANGHLPGVPSAEQVTSEGIAIGQMQARLLEKIEELTLHLIELKKENELLRERLDRISETRGIPE